MALADASGTVLERYVYDPYGKTTIYDDDWSDTVSWASSKQNEILYAGYRFDAETGLYHVRNRMYHPTLGRWLQRDPNLPRVGHEGRSIPIASQPGRSALL